MITVAGSSGGPPVTLRTFDPGPENVKLADRTGATVQALTGPWVA